MNLCERALATVWPDRHADPAALLASQLARKLATSPLEAPVWTAMGAAQLRCGDPKRALSALRKACAIDGANVLARSLLGEALLGSGMLTEGAALYRERWTLANGTEPMRYDPRLLWDGSCEAGKRLLLWTGDNADPGFVLVRLAPLLTAQGMEVALDLPSDALALACRWWPRMHPDASGGQFDCHYPLADLLALWINADPETLRKSVQPLPLEVHLSASGGTRVGFAADLSRPALSGAMLREAIEASGAEAWRLTSARGWALVPGTQADEMPPDLLRQLSLVDAVVTASPFVAHVAGLTGKPFVYLRDRDDAWCWGHADGRCRWYTSGQVVDGARHDVPARLPAILHSLLD